MNEENDKDVKEFLEMIKGTVSEEKTKQIAEILPENIATRNAFFQAAGIDKSIFSQLEDASTHSNSLHEICQILAPQLRKALNIDLQESESGGPEFKQHELPNILDEIDMSNSTVANVLELIAKCYNEDKDEDWHELSQELLPYVDKFFAPSYRRSKELGLEDEGGLS